MSRSASDRRVAVLVAAFLALAGCPEPGVYRLGVNLNTLALDTIDPDAGIHPDQSVLTDPNNPFVRAMDENTKFEVESYGVPVPRFYVWATVLARIPTGEAQYYTANALRDVYLLEQAAPEDLYLVREKAIRAYQTVLDVFPDSVTFDVTGRTSFPLAPLAFEGIEALGGTPEGGWVRVATPEGGSTIVKVGS